jgi:hypothetical protein
MSARRRSTTVEVPDGIEPLIGYREWAVLQDGGRPLLRSLFHPTVWPNDRPLSAVCLRPLIWHGRNGIGHQSVPDSVCECGIYAFRHPDFDTLRGAKGPKVRGVVRGWGRYVLGASGWRCQFVAVAAFLDDAEDPEATRALARSYRVDVVAPRDGAFELPPAVGM